MAVLVDIPFAGLDTLLDHPLVLPPVGLGVLFRTRGAARHMDRSLGIRFDLWHNCRRGRRNGRYGRGDESGPGRGEL